MPEIRIHRAGWDDPFVHAPRATPQDRRLTYAARGMLWYLISKPLDWVVQPKELEEDDARRDKVYSLLKELIDAGYIVRTMKHGETGSFRGVEYLVYPVPVQEAPFTDLPYTAEPLTAKPHTTENRVLQKPDSVIHECITSRFAAVGIEVPGDHYALLKTVIALFVFESTTPATVQASVTRAGALVSGKKVAGAVKPGIKAIETTRQGALPNFIGLANDVPRFVMDWQRRNPDLNLPTSIDSFPTEWAKWRARDDAASAAPPPPPEPETPAILEPDFDSPVQHGRAI